MRDKIKLLCTMMLIVSSGMMIHSIIKGNVHLVLSEGIVILTSHFFILLRKWSQDEEDHVIGNHMSMFEIKVWQIIGMALIAIQVYRLFQYTSIIQIKYVIFDILGIVNTLVLLSILKMMKEIKQDEVAKEI